MGSNEKQIIVLSFTSFLLTKNSLFVYIVAHELCYLFSSPGVVIVYIIDKMGSYTKRRLRHLSHGISSLTLILIMLNRDFQNAIEISS